MAPEVYDFDGVRVDLKRVEVTRGGVAISLEPKTFDILRFLIEHRDRLVTKEELLDAVWKDTFVTPNVLTRAVAQLRKALGDDAFEARYVETVSKRGYRFIAPVTVLATPAVEQAPPKPPSTAQGRLPAVARRPRRPTLLAGLSLGAVTAIGLAIFFAISSRRPAMPSADTTASPVLRRVTVGGESYVFPAISPDGSRIAYATDRTGSMEVYVTAVEPGGRELALTSDGGQNTQPSWSPDGQWLAYYSRLRGGVWVVQAAGGVPRRVADFGSQPFWSPDGNQLVFSSYAGAMAMEGILWTVRRDGAGARPLTKPGSPAGGHSQPSWSHDGRLIAFVSYNGQTNDIWTVPAGGGEATKVGIAGGFGAPKFSPDDGAVYFAGRTPEGNDGLVRVSVDDRGAPAGEPAVVLPFAGSSIGGLSIARDGTTVMALDRGTGNLWAVDVLGGAAAGPPLQLTNDDVRNTAPSYSTDGKRVAFQQQVVGQPSTAWLIDEDGKNREPLSPGLSGAVQTPQFSPDGKRVFVRVATREEPPFFAWLDLATRQTSRLPSLALDSASPVSLSPNGEEIAFHGINPGGAMNVWSQRLDGSARRQITFDKESMTYPAWSRDGNWLSVEIKRGDVTSVGVVSRNGGPVEQLTFDKGQSWPSSSSWAPDNDRIAFAGERDGVWNIYSVSRRTKQVTQLTNLASPDEFVRYPTWSPKGNRIIFERSLQKGSLWTVKLP